MPTNAEKRRQKKKKAREKKIRHFANIRRNNFAEPRYRLDVFLGDVWRTGVMTFKSMERVEQHKEDTERRRALGEEIVAGRVVFIETGKVVATIEASQPKPVKGELPDKLAESESAKKAELPEKPMEKESGKKGLLGFFKKS